MKTTHYFSIVNENWIQSILRDIFTTLAWTTPLIINHVYLDSKWYIDIFFLIIGLTTIQIQTNNFVQKFKLLFKQTSCSRNHYH